MKAYVLMGNFYYDDGRGMWSGDLPIAVYSSFWAAQKEADKLMVGKRKLGTSHHRRNLSRAWVAEVEQR